jgi:hypothetical protein
MILSKITAFRCLLDKPFAHSIKTKLLDNSLNGAKMKISYSLGRQISCTSVTMIQNIALCYLIAKLREKPTAMFVFVPSL